MRLQAIRCRVIALISIVIMAIAALVMLGAGPLQEGVPPQPFGAVFSLEPFLSRVNQPRPARRWSRALMTARRCLRASRNNWKKGANIQCWPSIHRTRTW